MQKNASKKKRLDENATKKKRLGPSLQRLSRKNVLQDVTSWLNNVTLLAENVENTVRGRYETFKCDFLKILTFQMVVS